MIICGKGEIGLRCTQQALGVACLQQKEETAMKIDLYTKAVLTIIAIGIGCLAFDTKPIEEAHAITKMKLKQLIKINSSRIVDVNTKHNSNYNALKARIVKLESKYK